MTRVIAILVVAALCATIFGVDEPTWAAQDDAARQAAERRAIVERISKIKVLSVVKIENKDGRKIEGMLTDKAPDSITVNVYQRRRFRRLRRVGMETIPIDDIKSIKKPLTAAQTALITAGVIAGTCAALAITITANMDTAPRAPGSLQDSPPAGDIEAPLGHEAADPSDGSQESLAIP